MLILLPFYFAAGFCLGYFWPEVTKVRKLPEWRRTSNALISLRAVLQEQSTLPVTILAAFAFCFLIIAAHPTSLITTGLVLKAAGVVVGSLAGGWFRKTRGTRDKLAFVGGASIFLFLAALEYDHRLFANLEKIGGSEFSVEFSNQGHANDRPTAVSQQQGSLSVIFPGSSGLDFSLKSLVYTPQSMIFDEGYAILFSKNSLDTDDFIAEMPILTKEYLHYACTKISPFAQRLLVIQKYNKGEMSDLSTNPEIVPALRDMYLQVSANLMPNGKADAHTRPGKKPEEHLESTDQIRDIFNRDNLLISAETASLGEIKSVTSITLPGECNRVKQELFNRIVSGSDLTSSGRLNLYDKLVNYFYPGNNWISRVDQSAERDLDPLGFLTYFALTLANTEFAVGARETAIQFLENEIVRARQLIPTLPQSYPQMVTQCPSIGKNEECQAIRNKMLEYVRHLVLLLRLEFTRNSMMSFLSNPAMDLARVRRWIETSKDYEDALTFFDPAGLYRKSLAREGIDSSQAAQCAPDVRLLGEQASLLFGKFTLAEISAKNNALSIAANNSEILTRQPLVVRDLDKFANDVAAFDLECSSRLIGEKNPDAPSNIPATKARFLDSVGGYWLAKGQNFGGPDDNDNGSGNFNVSEIERTKSLCLAKVAYRQARDFATAGAFATKSATSANADQSSADGVAPSLDEEVEKDNETEFPYRIQSGLQRTNLALNALPAGDVDKACK